MIIKKFIFILILFAITNCGYQPIYSKKNSSNISINKIKLKGDRIINRKIISLTNLRENNNDNYSYNLDLNSSKIVQIVAKDTYGNATTYKITIMVKLSLKDPNNQDEIIKTKNFSSSFLYNSIINKFDQLQYQKTIETNLIQKISEDITIFINP